MAPDANPEYRIVHNEPAGQWEARLVDPAAPAGLGAVIGYMAYDYLDSAILITSTVVMEAYRGRGIAGALARTGLEEIRAGGQYKVVPICWYVKDYVAKHPEFADLLLKNNKA